jgi:polar amino acid transport system permease protein
MYTLQFSWLGDNISMLVRGAAGTLLLTTIACLAGSVIGLAMALARNNSIAVLRATGASYVEAIRNTPLLAQAFLIYFGLATIGWRLTPMTAGALALTINCGAYTAEIFRAGFLSIGRPQSEAAACLGLSNLQSFFYVILPQAMRNIWVPLSGQFVLILLASSIVSQISAEELTSAADQIQSVTFRSFEVYIVVAIIYVGLAATFKVLLRWLGWRFLHARGRRTSSISRMLGWAS